jgi:fumarylacetoacetate (FAA) hydrolase
MKLGTLKDGTRDGRLVVVSRDLAHAVAAGPIRTLQQALEDWAAAAQLEAHAGLNAAARPTRSPSTQRKCAPLPRVRSGSMLGVPQPVTCWKVSAWSRRREAHGAADVPGAGDDFLGSHDDMPLPSDADGMDEGEVMVASIACRWARRYGGRPAHQARHAGNDEPARDRRQGTEDGFGLCSKPATSFAPVAVTPDECRPEGWRDGYAAADPVFWNGRNSPSDCGRWASFEAIAHVAHAQSQRRHDHRLGTISNSNYREVGSAASPSGATSRCRTRQAAHLYMKFGDRVRIEMLDARASPSSAPSTSASSRPACHEVLVVGGAAIGQAADLPAAAGRRRGGAGAGNGSRIWTGASASARRSAPAASRAASPTARCWARRSPVASTAYSISRALRAADGISSSACR